MVMQQTAPLQFDPGTVQASSRQVSALQHRVNQISDGHALSLSRWAFHAQSYALSLSRSPCHAELLSLSRSGSASRSQLLSLSRSVITAPIHTAVF